MFHGVRRWRGDDHRGRQRTGQLHGETRAREHRDISRGRQFLDEHFAHALERLLFKPLDGAHDEGSRTEMRRHLPRDRPNPVRRHRHDCNRGAGQHFGNVGRDRQAGRKDNVRQIDGVCAAGPHFVHERCVPAPQRDVVADAGQVHGESGAPTPRPDDGNSLHVRFS